MRLETLRLETWDLVETWDLRPGTYLRLETWVSRVLQHPPMKAARWQARTRTELMIEVWEALDCESVGEQELIAIQAALSETLGAGAVVSPAAIARELADEGAVLRHPEVLLCDTKWREQQAAQLKADGDIDFSNLVAAKASLLKIDKLRREAEAESNKRALQRLRALVVGAGEEARLVARSRVMPDHERVVAKEIMEWVKVWLQQPELFADWLSLRQRSPEYRKEFSD